MGSLQPALTKSLQNVQNLEQGGFPSFHFLSPICGVSAACTGGREWHWSCRAFPFRAAEVDWDVCPPELPCCNEYGYCRTREEWGLQNFRDCNGASNGIELPDSVLELENALGGEPGPGLGADSDFDKRQLEK